MTTRVYPTNWKYTILSSVSIVWAVTFNSLRLETNVCLMLTLYLDVIHWGLVRYYSSWQAGESFMAYLQNIWVLFSISFSILYLVHDRCLPKDNTTLLLIPITTYQICYRDCNNAFPSPATKWYRLACFLQLYLIYWLVARTNTAQVWNGLAALTTVNGHVQSTWTNETGWSEPKFIPDPYLRVHGLAPVFNYGSLEYWSMRGHVID